MKNEQLFALHDATTKKCKAIMEAKNNDYSGGEKAEDALANFKQSRSLGLHPVMGLLLRMQDKMMRVRSFVSDGKLKVSGESVEDAFDDMINYAILGKALLIEEREEIKRLAQQPELPLPDERETHIVHAWPTHLPLDGLDSSNLAAYVYRGVIFKQEWSALDREVYSFDGRKWVRVNTFRNGFHHIEKH